jgi:DNA-binding MarR family transcriptional regulator
MKKPRTQNMPSKEARQDHSAEAQGSQASKLAALDRVFSETVALFHRLRAVAEEVHRQGEMTAGKRGILKDLAHGPQTVPQMARARPVSRQHIQSLVDMLEADGYVYWVENPAHKRSLLVRLTPKGEALFQTMRQKEAERLSALEIDIEEKDLETTVCVLRSLRELLATEQKRGRSQKSNLSQT